MTDTTGRDNNDESESPSIFDLFEPPPDPDPGTFGKVKVVRGEDEDFDRKSGTTAAERKTAAEAEAAGLAHWTAPASGQIPAVFGGDNVDSDLWGDVKGPSWQSDDPNWSGPDLADVFAGSDDAELGADDEPATTPAPTPRPSPVPRPTPSSVASSSPTTSPVPGRSEVTVASDIERGSRSSSVSAASSTGSRSEQSTRPGAGSSRADVDDWAVNRRPPPPDDTSEGRRIPGAEPPAALDSTEIASSVGSGDLTSDAPHRSGGSRTGGVPAPESGGSRRSAGATTPLSPPRRSVQLERSVEPPQPPGLRSQPDIDLSEPGFGEPAPPQFDRSPVDGYPGFDDGTVVPEVDPTAPELYADPRRDRYPADDGYSDGFDSDDDSADGERSSGRSLPVAIATGVALAALVLAALWLGAEAMTVLVTAVAVLGAIELYNAMRLAGLRPATLLGLAGTAAFPVAAFVRGDAAYTLLTALMVVFGVLWYLSGADSERPVLNLSLTMLGVYWIGGLGSFAALILRNEEFGIPLLLSTIVITVASDTMAYFGGRAFGRRPFHSASPNKTWEGTLTGFVFAVFVSFAVAVMPFTTMWDGRFLSALLMGVVVGVLAPLGDLAESLIKRDLGVKDMGTIVPGHGGILDRVDALLFALPGAFYVALLAGIV